MFGRRDHEDFIGGYDPEHEMPDGDRDAGDRYQSDAYRSNARDSRFSYRWDADRFEERTGRGERDFNRFSGRDPREESIRSRDEYDRVNRQYESNPMSHFRSRGYTSGSRDWNAERNYRRGMSPDYARNRDDADLGYGRDYSTGAGRSNYASDHGRRGYGGDIDRERFGSYRESGTGRSTFGGYGGSDYGRGERYEQGSGRFEEAGNWSGADREYGGGSYGSSDRDRWRDSSREDWEERERSYGSRSRGRDLEDDRWGRGGGRR